MKRFIVLVVLIALSVSAFAQTRKETMLEYQQRRVQAYKSYMEKRRQAYADYMRQRWEAYNTEKAIEQPKRIDPVEPTIKNPEQYIRPDENVTPADKVKAPEVEPAKSPLQNQKPATKPADKPAAKPVEKPAEKPTTKPNETVSPKPEPAQPSVAVESMEFAFYGAPCNLTLGKKHRFTLRATDENSVADAWEHLDGRDFDKLIEECKQLKSDLRLNDWGYYMLTEHIAEEFLGKGSNEAAVLHAYLLAEAGYKMRLGRISNRLCVMIASKQTLYGKPYSTIGSDRYYIVANVSVSGGINICNFKSDAARAIDLSMSETPALPYLKGDVYKRSDKRSGSEFSIVPNANLTAFLNDYPQCEWSIYAETALSEMTYLQLAHPVKRLVEGKNERDGVQSLLTFIHNSFPYKTDGDQFGYERTLFADEMFAYMYSDCEDRSILFCRLVKEILNMDVVLLHYPNHIAAAVRFTQPISGDSVSVDGRQYVVCDPTYIGASVGDTMPQFVGTKPEVVKVK